MKIRSIIWVLLAFVATHLPAQMNKIDYVEYDLDNGIHVILHQDNSTPIVVVSVMYHVERGQFDKYINGSGGANNANTWYDRTYYYEILPSNQLALGLWLESERLLHAKVDIKGVETQREVVKEERRQRVDNQPYGSIVEEAMKRAYTVHPYRWPVIGYMEHLNAAKEEDYVNFYKDFYVPENAVISIAGDLDVKEAKALVEKYCPDIVEPDMTAEVRDTVYDNIQLPAVVQTYRIPAQGTPDYYAVDMLATLLAQGESSRLRKSLVDEQQKALFVGNFPFALEDPGVALAFGIANMGINPSDLEVAMDVEIAKVREELISEREFQKLRNQKENDFITANTRVAGIAESLANYHMYFGDANLINTEIDRYLEVTREDIQKAAQKYFVPTNRVVLYYLPKSEQP